MGDIIKFEPKQFDNVDRCIDAHRRAFEEWTEGEPVESWLDDAGVLCIKYDSGKWWHYRDNKGSIEWW